MRFLSRFFQQSRTGLAASPSAQTLIAEAMTTAEQTLRMIHSGLAACQSLERRENELKETSRVRRQRARQSLQSTPDNDHIARQHLKKALAAEQELKLLEPALTLARKQSDELLDEVERIGIRRESLETQLLELKISESRVQSLADATLQEQARSFEQAAQAAEEEIRRQLATAEARQELATFLNPELEKLKKPI